MYEEISILSINGSDSSACAGIQADARTITALGGYALTAITSVTVQDRHGISSVYDLPAHMVAGQVRAILSQQHPRAVKVGLLRHTDTLAAVAQELQYHTRVVMAPGLIASSGEALVEPDVVRMWETALSPMQHSYSYAYQRQRKSWGCAFAPTMTWNVQPDCWPPLALALYCFEEDVSPRTV